MTDRPAVPSSVAMHGLALLLVALALGVPAHAKAADPASRPSVLVILADDLGYSDLGAFGGEIDTPNLDRLARQGTRFTSMYAAPACVPSRAELLTGRDHHVVGLGGVPSVLAPSQRGRPGYEGYLLATPTLAERFRAAGYFTAMTGKWEMGRGPGQWPSDRGFTESFGLLGGAANYFGLDQAPGWESSPLKGRYVEGRQPAALPANVYATDYYAERLIGFLRSRPDPRQPFFAYLAFTAPHWPLQAPEQLVQKYLARYRIGPDAIREARMKRMRSMQLLPASAPRSQAGKAQRTARMSPEERERSTRLMAVYAAMVESLDHNVGKVIALLEATGQLENTVILVMSDNGAEGMDPAEFNGFLSETLPDFEKQEVFAANANLDRVGSGRSYTTYGPEWGGVSAAPWRGHKGSLFEGGYRVPAIIKGPGIPSGKISHAPVTIRDAHWSLLAIAGLTVDAPERGSRSLLDGGDARGKATAFEDARELLFRRAIRRGNWKAVFDGDSGATVADPATFRWQLYDLDKDPFETRDLASSKPGVLEDLKTAWESYAREHGVVLP